MTDPKENGQPLGYVVLTHNIGLGWQDDWDGRVHASRDVANTEFDQAAEALGDDAVMLCALFPVEELHG